MNKTLCALVLCLIASTPSWAQDWSVGVSTGPFVFGDFVKRTTTIATETGSAKQTVKLSATPRPGLGIDVERNLSDYFAIRAEGTFTRAPLTIKGPSGSGVNLEAGDINVGTFMLPIVFRLNPRGSFRFHVLAGPAYAAYRITRQPNAALTIHEFVGTRGRWGFTGAAGIAWHWTQRFAVEGQIADISTSSPFSRDDFPANAIGTITIPRPHNIHTTIGVRTRF